MFRNRNFKHERKKKDDLFAMPQGTERIGRQERWILFVISEPRKPDNNWFRQP